MPAERRPRFLLLLWTLVLLAPIAWSVLLNVGFPLVELVCKRNTHTPLYWLAALCLIAAVAAPLVAWRKLADVRDTSDAARSGRFLLELTIGMSVTFVLVILATIVPMFLLNPCPP